MNGTSNNDIGLIGLGVMGSSLALNLADNGYRVICFDADETKMAALLERESRQEKGENLLTVSSSISALIKQIKDPSIILLSVPAGHIVDEICVQLKDSGLNNNAIVVDTGNSLWTDAIAREAKFEFNFFSTAVSGGEVGARFGPSLMASGPRDVWKYLQPIFNAIAAKVEPSTGIPLERKHENEPLPLGEPCAAYIGSAGSASYVKMVHNGIEYADMQLICEAYQLLRERLNLAVKDIAKIFRKWNDGPLNSYLMEISAEILQQLDPESKLPLVDIILDKAGQKGTGLWTAISALKVGSPAQTIAQAVFARAMSSMKDERVFASQHLDGPAPFAVDEQDIPATVDRLQNALYCSKICVYAQGFQLMAAASREQGWQLDYSSIAKIWRAGCIIRAAFLQDIARAFDENEHLQNLLLDPFFKEKINTLQLHWRQSIADAVMFGVPHPAMSSALSYYDSYRSALLPANLLQAQRDFFGAHTFEKQQGPKNQKYHLTWSESPRRIVAID